MPPILRIALDVPLRQLFDYRPPPGIDAAQLRPGMRVRVPFGSQLQVGILVETAERSALPPQKLKAALEMLDEAPVLDEELLAFVKWAAEYYHHPMGEVLAAALPTRVRTGKALPDKPTPAQKPPLGNGQEARVKQWAVRTGPELTAAQAEVLTTLSQGLDRFGGYLLYGVTGSGKTEVYLRAIEKVLALGRQALVLVPEIGLTPQLLDRFKRRFDAPLAVMHSARGHRARLLAWQQARSGEAAIVIGTRSAVFAPLPKLGLIVVDEEHDGSYKQQEGFRYSARDLAVARAHRQNVPIVLGSATPSLETLENAKAERYTRLALPERPGEARHPHVNLIDLRAHAAEEGLATPTLASIEGHLREGGQVLVYLNRRGYAPVLFCPGCGWTAPCDFCDAHLTVHLRPRTLRCHHCGHEQKLPFACPTCGHEVKAVGQGTERVEETLSLRFPDAPLVRFDSDSIKRKGAMQSVLDQVHSGKARILLGTQMLTKGHHFPDVTLVVIVNADQGLFSVDFRASERLAQTIVQVSGRAGRASKPGEVLIQTEFPQHPLLQRLLTSGYEGFAEAALQERAAAHWPPFSRLALLRAEAKHAEAALKFLEASAEASHAADTENDNVRLLGPVPATMARRAGYHRAQLLLESPSRGQLHRFLDSWLPTIEKLPDARGVRWSLDVDPADLY